MKPLIRRTIITLLIAILICNVFSIIMTAFSPGITNQIAMGQLENDDFAFAAWEMWSKTQNYFHVINWIVWGITAFSVGKDVYNYFKNRKENN